MTQVIASPATDDSAPSDIVELRNAVGDALKRQYGATRQYAIALCNSDYMPTEWYEVEHNSLKEEDKPVLKEASLFRAALKAAGHTNPSVMWTRVRAEAREYMNPSPKGEGEGDGTGPKPRKSLQLRLIEDLTSLFKACKRADSLSDQQRNAQTGIASALAALGVDISAITK